jgi:hypothetical protein
MLPFHYLRLYYNYFKSLFGLACIKFQLLGPVFQMHVDCSCADAMCHMAEMSFKPSAHWHGVAHHPRPILYRSASPRLRPPDHCGRRLTSAVNVTLDERSRLMALVNLAKDTLFLSVDAVSCPT